MTTFGAKRSRHFDATQSRRYEGIATRLNQGLYRRIAADVDDLAAIGATVLDAGTGPGLLLEHIARRRPDLDLHGIDLSAHMIELAEHRMLAHPVELAVGDVTALPYRDNSFDIVLSSLSLHEWTDVPSALDELQRVLRPGGRLAVYPAAAAAGALCPVAGAHRSRAGGAGDGRARHGMSGGGFPHLPALPREGRRDGPADGGITLTAGRQAAAASPDPRPRPAAKVP